MALLSERAYAIETSRQRTLVIVPTILTFFAVLFVCLRLYARRLKKTKILLEDYLCIFATVRDVLKRKTFGSAKMLTRY